MKKILTLLILVVCSMCYGAAYTGSGSGTAGSPYLVTTYSELKEIVTCDNGLSSYWKLTANIDASASATENWNAGAGYYEGFIPIGNATTSFTGQVDGDDYTISNLYIYRPSINYQGFVGRAYIGKSGGSVKNLRFFNIDITGNTYVGGVCGQMIGTGIYDCYVGGDVTGYTSTGGVIGDTYSASAERCAFSGNVIGSDDDATGGFIGTFGTMGLIRNCYAVGSVTNGSGFVGLESEIDSWPGITKCYSAGTIIDGCGGFCCQLDYGALTYCYYDTTTSGWGDSGKGVPKTTTQMQQEATFETWDFETIWGIDEGETYPYLLNFSCTVPDIVGETVAEAGILLAAAGYLVGGSSAEYSNTVAAGIVISQEPESSTSYLCGAEVDYVVSLGKPAVPDIVGETQADANDIITAVDNLQVGNITTDYNNTVAAGIVISQYPAADTSVNTGSDVNFVVSLGKPVAPDVVGETQVDANAIIEAVDNLQVGNITTSNSEYVSAGLVISQNPNSGVSVDTGSSIDYVVSLGPEAVCTYYVSTTGNNSNDGLGSGDDHAWQTIQYALDNAVNDCIISVASGEYTLSTYISVNNTNSHTLIANGTVTLTCTNDSAGLYIPAAATGSLHFSGYFHWNTATAQYLIKSANSNTGSGVMTFTNNTFTVTDVDNNLLTTGTAAAQLRKFIFNNCNISVEDSVDGFAAVLAANVAEITFNDCNMTKATAATTSYFIRANGAMTLLQVIDCNIISDAQNIVDYSAVNASLVENTVLRGNVVHGGKSFFTALDENVGAITIENNTITTSNEGNPIELGLNLHTTPTYLITGSIIKNNTIYKTSASGHLIRIGTNCRNPQVTYNNLYSTDTDDYGLVIKANGNYKYNTIKSNYPIYLCGASDANVWNNTLIQITSVSESAMLINVNGATSGRNNSIINNIFDGRLGALAFNMVDSADVNLISNYNCFVDGTTAMALIDSVSKTLSQYLSWWSTNGGTATSKLNDTNSINPIDPCFANYDINDFSLNLSFPSPCLYAGMPTAGEEYLIAHYTFDDDSDSNTVTNTGRKNIGAYNPNGTSVRNTSDTNIVGRINGAFSFNGTTDSINTGQTLQSVLRGDSTWAFWLKPTDGQPPFVSKVIIDSPYDYATDNYFLIELDINGGIYIDINISGASCPNVGTGTVFPDGATSWKFITVVLKQVTATTIRIYIYIDGIIVKTGDEVITQLSNYTNSNNFIIGGAGNETYSLYSGSLDDLRVYNKALTDREIILLYRGDVERANFWLDEF